jgi:glycerol-1-phosphate dehydrogenase [NAD(P)+]
VHIPIAVVVDLDFVETGSRHSRAGIGEMVSNISALADWELAHTERGEPVDGLAVTLARTGAEAVLNHPGDMADDEFVTVLAEALIASGMAMAICGTSRPVSGGCHEISHAIDIRHPGAALHAEQVGVGALFCTYLRRDEHRFVQLAAALARHGLPRTPADLGLTDEEFTEIVGFAPHTRPGRYTILERLELGPHRITAELTGYLDALGQLRPAGRHARADRDADTG